MKRSVAAALLGVLVAGSWAEAGDRQGAYVRLDAGRSWARDASIMSDGKTIEVSGYYPIAGPSAFTDRGVLDEIGESYVLGGGIGYRLNGLMRLDATARYAWGFHLNDQDQYALDAEHFEADIRAWAFMANGYIDLPITLGVFKPFIGAGVGLASIETDEILKITSAGLQNDVLPGGRTQNFAWQLMAGATVELTEHVSLEMGYRYLDAGKIKTDGGTAVMLFNQYGDPPAMYGVHGATGQLTTQEVSLGLIYNF